MRNLMEIVIHCEFYLSRVLPYFRMLVSQSVTGVTSQFFPKIWLYRPGKPYTFWMHIMEDTLAQLYRGNMGGSKILSVQLSSLLRLQNQSQVLWKFELPSECGRTCGVINKAIRSSKAIFFINVYRTWVRSLAMLVSNWLPNWLTNWLPFSKLDWCDPGVWRCLLKTCWGCYCCWC